LAIGAASNALGTINDVPRATAMAREAGALSFVDAVHFAPHSLVNVRKLGCDFLGCSAYKFYGPHLGILFGRREVMETLEPPKLEPAPDSAPERMETGTQNHEGIVGAAAAVEFLASLGGSEAMSRRDRLELVFEELHRRSAQLLYRLWSGLEGIAGVKLYGPPYDARRTPTVSFTLEQCPSDELSQRLADAGIFASHGNFYAQTAVRRLGVGPAGLLRLGCAVYTTEAEVDRVIEAVQIVAGR
jgi:selenocysteine lyase/cysteine desulfurase